MKRKNERQLDETKKHQKTDDWAENLKKVIKEEKKQLKLNQVKTKEQNPVRQNDDKSEKDFHLEQSKKRSELRIERGRATVFDKLLQISKIYAGEIQLEEILEVQKPYTILEKLQYPELDSLKSSIELHLRLEKNSKSKEYWNSLLTICEHLLLFNDSSLKQEISNLVESKSLQDLNTLKLDVIQKIDKNTSLDQNFWTEVLSTIDSQKSKLKLEQLFREIPTSTNLTFLQANNLQITHLFSKNSQLKVNLGDGRHSPPPCQTVPEGFEVVEEESDVQEREAKKKEVLEREVDLLMRSQSRLSIKSNPFLSIENNLLQVDSIEKIKKNGVCESIEDLMRLELAKKSLPDESEFGELVNIKPVLEDWMKKFKPRKPKFFNRIKTGYEWTRYNQSHYDHFNPPPKVVQGYKFNILYPYLIDKSKAPQFYLHPDEDNETCIIRFHAGPPYEDIAFRIENKEWDFTDRNGFKCFFEKGILHLYFSFKRYRYKR